MTDEDAIFAFRTLSAALKERGYQWLLHQVEETINLGKLTRAEAVDYSDSKEIGNEENEITTSQHPKRGRKGRKAKGRKVEIDRIEPYAPIQRLHILLRAMERTFVDTARMQQAAASVLTELDNVRVAETVIGFDDEDVESVSLSRASQRRGAVDRLSRQLGELRKAAV